MRPGAKETATGLRSSVKTTAAAPAWFAYISLELAEGVQLSSSEGGHWLLTQGERQVPFWLPPGRLPEVFSRLRDEGWTLLDLMRLLDDFASPLSVNEQVHRLWRDGLLVQVLRYQGKVAAVLRASGDTKLIPTWRGLSERIVLTEDACIRKEGSIVLIEALEFGAAVQLKVQELFGIPLALVHSVTCEALALQTSLPRECVAALIAWLVSIGAARVLDSEGQCDTYPGWAFADRLLHSRSRMGRHIGGYGGTFALRGKVPEPPALRPVRGGKSLELPVPNLESITRRDPTFTDVIERRRSLREHSQMPIQLAELSEFLYRCSRVKINRKDEDAPARPFPSGGGLYELEFYVLANRCQGLPPSLYYYDGVAHSLEHVSDATGDTRRILTDAVRSSGMHSQPHVLVILAARFLRVNWKYESMAYSLILKNVGVVYQTMYLVATAMGLAPCALGGGSAAAFCRAAGTSYWEESSVGEFLLGRPANILET